MPCIARQRDSDRRAVDPAVAVQGSFAGSRVLVTGGSSGIGRATVLAFAAAGADVVAAGRDQGRLSSVREEAAGAAGTVETIVADLRDEVELRRLVAETWAEGPLDVLVNNAGVCTAEPFLDISLESWQNVIGTNLNAPFLLAQACARKMATTGGGAIINVASTDSFVAESPQTHYNVAKAGLLQLTRCIAWELGHLGIRCNAVCPGLTLTPMIEPDRSPEFDAAYLSRIPLRRGGRPEDSARAILFLASEDASFVNGAALLVDGGQLAGFWYDPRFAPPLPDSVTL